MGSPRETEELALGEIQQDSSRSSRSYMDIIISTVVQIKAAATHKGVVAVWVLKVTPISIIMGKELAEVRPFIRDSNFGEGKTE